MLNAEELALRLANLVTAARASLTRASAKESFGSAEELEEIGFLVMRMAALEESISLFCEILLVRPELGGFHTVNRSVLTKQFGEKINLYKALIIASGVLYGIGTESIEKNIATLKAVGEDRNTIIHGLLCRGSDGEPAFRGRGRDVQATLGDLRRLTKRCHEVASDLVSYFPKFYTDLVGKKSIHVDIEASVQNVLQARLQLYTAENASREAFLTTRDAELELIQSTRKLEELRAQLAAAKKALRKAKAKERRPKKHAVKNAA